MLKDLRANLELIWRNNPRILTAMTILLMAGVSLAVLSFFNLSFEGRRLIFRFVGFGENYYFNVGYYNIVYAGLGLTIGILHNIIITKMYKKGQKAAICIFLGMSFAILILAAITMLRVLGVR
ncbi:hypothetical protein FWH09_02250 [Candidatus Saccharibacteria bacterium]|nr:hypothetical protein [Candidatus Saccharibacteria bacterium]